MTPEKLRTMQMAIEITGLQMDLAALELFCMVRDEIDKKGDQFTVMDACKIRNEIQRKHGTRLIMYSLNLMDKE